MRTSRHVRTSLAVGALSLGLLAGPLPAGAGTAAEGLRRTAPGIAEGQVAATSPAAALEAAHDVLGLDGLGLDADDFTFTTTRRSLIGTHHRGGQHVDGVPVAGTSASVHVVEGAVVKVTADGTDAPGGPTPAPIAAVLAEATALRHLGTTRAAAVAVDAERALVEVDGRLVDTWRVGVVAPGIAAVVDVDAATARVRDVADERLFHEAGHRARHWARHGARHDDGRADQRASAVATLFDPNPIATSGHLDLRQDVDAAGVDVDASTDPRVAAELVDLPLRDFDAARAAGGNLVGPWVDVIGAGPMVPVGGRLDVTKTDPRFEGLMGYHHIDAIQRWFQDELGLDDVNAEPQTFVALPVMGFDNSFYQPANDLILVGAGGVDDGEDAEVIIHELGHAIHDDQVPGWGRAFEGGAMGEGFGDFLAAAYFATFDTTLRSQDTCVMEWDATSYSPAEQTCLRRLDTAKTYADRDGSVHSTGEIWSKYMWNVREHLGADEDERSRNALRLLLTAHELMSTQADFREAIGALLTTAGATGVAPDAEAGAAWQQVLRAEAVALGMPLPGA